ncbi:DNA translocase FtsK [Streptomyces sp. V1I1]|uniref:DNA translocase FtsK n=1 Tax=Streptomyces sp. V1I1 TaxID=3042272 RepID=UPI0027829E04|nr:DNA translocase FtsK [Streptomyces sp. V1I1]MDQ0940731.1 energy-coupling factor transporter ATP-binding protein EcfA2 [Streptomyces sp. V1I1]
MNRTEESAMGEAQDVLTEAICVIVRGKFEAGFGYLRLPYLSPGMPLERIVDRLSEDIHGLSVANFASTRIERNNVTDRVTVAIRWRNEGKRPILVIGDLHRNRAHGLMNVPQVTADEVREAIFATLGAENAHGVSENVAPLLAALQERNIPLDYVADYCAALNPLKPGSGDLSRKLLWRLGLLPDHRTAQPIDSGRLQLNEQTVDSVRMADPGTLQRFIANSTAEYARLREFGRFGRRELLAGLNLDDVIDAMRVASVRSRARFVDDALVPDDRVDILDLVNSGEVSEEDLLEAVRDHDGGSQLELNSGSVTWDAPSLEQLLNDPSLVGAEPKSSDEAAEESGTLFGNLDEVQPANDESLAEFYGSLAGGTTPKFGTATQWQSLGDLRQDLQDLADDAPVAGRLALDAFDRLADSRMALAPYAPSIPSEGIRLFVGSQTLRSQGDELVSSWEDLWSALRQMREEIPTEQATYVKRMADALTLVDVVAERDSDGTRARLLPLHPVVLEPRVRAAKIFREMQSGGELDSEFLDTVSANIDPAAPSLGVVIGKDPEALAFSGVSESGEPVYGKKRLASGTPETTHIVQQVIDRFLVAYPFAQLSLCVALIRPTPTVVRRLFERLQDPKFCSASRIVLRVFSPEDVTEIRNLIAAAEAEHDERSRVIVEIIEKDPDAGALQAGGAPHVAFLFDVSDGGTAGFGSLLQSEQQGSVVTEWLFVTHKRTTVIKPAASGRLAALLNQQSKLSSADPAELDRSPLLSPTETARLSELGQATNWLVLVESTSALAAPENIDLPEQTEGELQGGEDGRLHLLGRVGSGSHTAYVYCRDLTLLVDPPLRMMQGNSWLDPEPNSLMTFLTNTVRRALPEGLLGFFGTKGPLSDDAILGRIGVAAVLAELQEDEGSLVMSLDTDAARKWLQRRRSNRRADLLQIKWNQDGPCVKVIEVKSTRDALEGGIIPQHVHEASEQVLEMMDVLRGVFSQSSGDLFAASRREILKRQVFLEALQQWEETRVQDWPEYKRRLRSLNDLFKLDPSSEPVRLEGEVVVVGIDAPQSNFPDRIGDAGLPLKVLGGDWLRSALRHGRDQVAVPSYLGDLLSSLGEDSPQGDAMVATGSDGHQTFADSDSDADQHPQQQGEYVQVEGKWIDDAERAGLAHQVINALRARNVPLRSLNEGDIVTGPSVLRVPFELEPGARLSTLANQEMDIARDLGVSGIRVDNLPGRARYAVLEIPRQHRSIADVSELVVPAGQAVAVALGTDYEFNPFWVPLHELPHLLIAGTTGSGKSTLLRSMLWQLTRMYPTDALDLVLVDAKGMGDFRDLARAPQIRQSGDYHLGADGALDLLGDIVERRVPERIEIFNEYAEAAMYRADPKNITDVVSLGEDAAARGEDAPLKPLVVVIDEFSEIALSSSDRRRFETLVTRFVQRARAVGGHLITATQRPSVEIVPGVMKANFARLSLMVRSATDSRVILDASGAERLLPMGDMLFASPHQGLVRLQGFSAQGPYLPVSGGNVS